MSELFNRVCEVQIINYSVGKDKVKKPIGKPRTVNNLRIAFNITNSAISNPSFADITIFNASTSTSISNSGDNNGREPLLTLLQKPNTEIIVKAGYRGNVEVIFHGDVYNVFNRRNDVDTYLQIYASMGLVDYNTSRPKNDTDEYTTLSQLLKKLVASFPNNYGIDLSGIQDILTKEDKKPFLAKSYTDLTNVVLTKLGEAFNFTWTNYNGTYVFKANDATVEVKDEDLWISSANGLLEAPTVTYNGVQVRTLLNNKFVPNVDFGIRNIGTEKLNYGNQFFYNITNNSNLKTEAVGKYNCVQVVHTGDTRDNSWYSDVTGFFDRGINSDGSTI